MPAGRKTADVAVVGGGPAGTAVALALLRADAGLQVTVLEAGGYGTPRIGETVPPDLRPTLDELGVWESFAGDGHLRSHGTCAAWGSSELRYRDFFTSTGGYGWHLDRARFDATLAREAEQRGADLLLETRLGATTRERSGWQLRLEHRRGNDAGRLEASFVVDASGRRAVFARRRGACKVLFDRLTAVASVLCFESDAAPEPRVLVEAAEDGWWYAARVPGDRAVVCWLSDSDQIRDHKLHLAEGWTARLAATRHIGPRARKAGEQSALAVAAAASHRLEPVAGDGWLAVGDAATATDPLASAGIVGALRSGIEGAAAIRRYLDGDPDRLDAYSDAVRIRFETYLEERRAYYALERRWPASRFWRRRREPIGLAPDRLLRRAAGANRRRAPGRASMHLPPADLERLCQLCDAEPRAAAEVVAAFLEERGGKPQRIIAALEYLIARGSLVTAPATA